MKTTIVSFFQRTSITHQQNTLNEEHKTIRN